jgi:hypothetical protein
LGIRDRRRKRPRRSAGVISRTRGYVR